MSWVLDPDDDAACVRALFRLHDLAAGLVVCHPHPAATWPVLVADLLRALGKHPRAQSRERRTTDGTALLQVWLRAENVRDLVVLRAHLLVPDVLAHLVDHAATAGSALWLVWHDQGPPPPQHLRLRWADAAAILTEHREPAADLPADVYATAFTAARHEARTWRPDGPRLGYRVPWWNHAWPGCDLGALLQRLTIDAESSDEVRVRLQAAADGFAAEGRCLALPDLGSDELAEIGPRLSPDTIARLRQLVCPTTAAALTLALATDSDAHALASHRSESGTDLIALPAGAYRLPDRVQPLLSAATLKHIRRHPAASLFAPTGKLRIGAPRLAHLIARGAALAGLPTPAAARPLSGHRPASPFAAAITGRASVTDH